MYTHAACLWKYCCSGDRLARHVHRGIGGSLRVTVQQERVVVGATSYNLSIFSLLLLSCLLFRAVCGGVVRVFIRADFFFSGVLDQPRTRF